jgi:uncharacterized protein (TIGR00369 family)
LTLPAFDDDTAARVRRSFANQGLMQTFGARIDTIEAGRCTISAPLGPTVSQQHGAGHAGLTFALGDTAAGYAALTAQPPGTEVMTAEIKINLLRPAVGERLIARGEIVKAGRRLCVVRAEIAARQDGTERLVAVMLGTMVPVDPA